MSKKSEYIEANLINKLNTIGEVIYRQYYGFEAETYIAFRENNSSIVKALVALCVKDGDSFKLTVNDEAEATTFNANAKLLSMLTPRNISAVVTWRERCLVAITDRRLKSKTTKTPSVKPSTKLTPTSSRPTSSRPTSSRPTSRGAAEARICELFKVAWADVRKTLPTFIINEPNISKTLGFNNRQNTLGLCRRYTSGRREVYFSRKYLALGDQNVLDILAHELIHTIQGCVGHNAVWQRYAREMTARTAYTITTRAPRDVVYSVRVNDPNYGKVVCPCGCEMLVSKRSVAWRKTETRVCAKHRKHLARVSA